ncbi:hypothetical protein D3C80_1439510 [compost metagenome]
MLGSVESLLVELAVHADVLLAIVQVLATAVGQKIFGQYLLAAVGCQVRLPEAILAVSAAHLLHAFHQWASEQFRNQAPGDDQAADQRQVGADGLQMTQCQVTIALLPRLIAFEHFTQ